MRRRVERFVVRPIIRWQNACNRVFGATLFGAVIAAACLVAQPATAETPGRLIEAIKAKDATAVTALLRQPAEVNARSADGTTPLHWAVRLDDVDTVRSLLKA